MILVVDDKRSAAQALAKILSRQGHLTKPVAPSTVLDLLQPVDRGAADHPVLVGGSSATQALRAQVQALAEVNSTVLIVGEPGSGRADLARSLHQEGRLLTLTGPQSDLPDLREVGTLLLPSVDLLSPQAQRQLSQLLDALPAAGGPRIVASAGEDWAQRAARDPISLQLYYRLAVLILRVPPLRDRLQDLPALLQAFLRVRAAQLGRATPEPSPEVLQALQGHDWPGNLRELQAVVERAVVFGSFQLGVERNPLRYKLKKFGLLDRVS